MLANLVTTSLNYPVVPVDDGHIREFGGEATVIDETKVVNPIFGLLQIDGKEALFQVRESIFRPCQLSIWQF
jgi:hypothetical protein